MHSPAPDCRFCIENNLLTDTPLYKNAAFYVLGMLDPKRAKAVMVVPFEHSVTPFEISGEAFSHLADALAFAKSHLTQFEPDGFTIGWNVGEAAGQTVFHSHMHVIRRFRGESAEGHGLAGLLRLVNQTG